MRTSIFISTSSSAVTVRFSDCCFGVRSSRNHEGKLIGRRHGTASFGATRVRPLHRSSSQRLGRMKIASL